MENNKGFKVAAIVALFVSIIGVSIAFAALSQNLNVEGNGIIDPATWNVHFTEIDNITYGKEATPATADPSLAEKDKVINYDFILTAPGDSISFTFKVINEGTLDAKISSVSGINKDNWTYSPVQEDQANPGQYITDDERESEQATRDCNLVKANLDFTLVYVDNVTLEPTGEVPAVDNELAAGDTVTLKLTVTYKESALEVPTGPVKVTPDDIVFTYIQNNQ